MTVAGKHEGTGQIDRGVFEKTDAIGEQRHRPDLVDDRELHPKMGEIAGPRSVWPSTAWARARS